MDTIITLLLFIFILGLIVLVHEFGHFFFSKLFHVHVYEFSIGMGPKIWGSKPDKGGTTYNIRAIPIGGFVSLAGEDALEDDKDVPVNERLYSKPTWQRFLIMVFGAGNNFILAFVTLLIIGIFNGSTVMTPVITKLEKDYPMYLSGIRENDKILEINGDKVSTIDDLQIYVVLASKNEESTFLIERDGKELEYKVTPKEEKDEKGNVSYKFGIVYEPVYEHGILNAFKFAFTKIFSLFKQMIITLKSLFTGTLGVKNLSGPVGIYSIVGTAKESGFFNLLSLLALLSVNVGFINLLPFPAFDGGRVLFLIIEKIKGSPVSPSVENTIHNIGFILLMILIIYITFNDILHLI